MSSYNGVLANLWRVILRKRGIDTESKLDVMIAKVVSRQLTINRKLNSKEIRKSSPSALKTEALGENMTFKSFIGNIKTLLSTKKIKFSIVLIDDMDRETECEYEVDL
jgi:hypothetical protein